MEKSAEKEGPITAIGAEQTERRSLRRRLVQSTLFPHKSPEIESNGDQKGDTNNEDNEDGDYGEFCGSQGKKTRKRKEKRTPQKGAPKKRVREKLVVNSTPKKNATNNGNISAILMESEDVTPPIPNLLLEAKLRAEENSRMFAGKQIHPFFSSWKAVNRNQEVAEVENNCCPVGIKDKSITMGPIHVFERMQDESPSIDWKNWTFCGNTSINTSCSIEGTFTAGFEGSVKALDSDQFPSVLHPSDASVIQNKVLDQYFVQQEDLHETSPAVSSMLGNEQVAYCQLLEESEEDCEVDEVTFLSGHASGVRKSCGIEHSRSFQESNQPENSLWTDKYQPKRAMQVCGNTESVKLMNEWLCLWRERGFQAIKDSTGGDKHDMRDDDYNCYGCDSDSENIDEGDSLKNVLLVTGPVGSGKSAAIHACAKEQGFKILESNASECRNGAVVKQKFGEALESHCLTRSLDNPVDSQKKQFMKFTQALYSGEVVHGYDDEVIELIPMSDEGHTRGAIETSEKVVCSENEIGSDRAKVKPLILFEDVDITFPEDRGFIAAIRQIAEKAKGPVILTSNNENPVLPDNLDRLELCFTVPSSKELLCHLSTVCAVEKVNVQPHLIEQLIGYCQGDIRKTIMHLQFWCQSKRHRKARKVQNTSAPQLFDLEVGHQMLPKIIPWGFQSQLSELVEKEIAKSLSIMEENSILMEVLVEEVDNEEMLKRLGVQNGKADSIEAKKGEMLKRNCSLHDYNEFEDPFDTTCEFSNFSGTLVSLSQQKIRRKPNVVVSSDSEDGLWNNRYPLVSNKNTDNELFLEDDSRFPSHCPSMQNCINPLTGELLHSEAKKFEVNFYRSEIANDSYINDSCKSVDVSCVPESSFVPETEIDNGAEVLSGAVSCGRVPETVEVSVNEEFIQNPSAVEAENLEKYVHRFNKSSEMFGSTCDAILGSSYGEEVEGSHDEHLVGVSRGYQVMDECSRMDFNRRSKPTEKFRFRVPNDLVQESWKKLCGSHTDLKQYVTSEPKNAFQVVQLTYRMTNLISEADMLLSSCQKLDSLELSVVTSKNSDAFSWSDEHLQMTSTMAQYGFCFYAKDIAAKGLSIGSETSVDLSWEMLASTTNMMALGRSIGQEARVSNTSNAGRGLEISPGKSEVSLKSERMPCLFNIIKSIVPSRSYLALKGNAFHEYVSSLGCISRSDTSHLSEGIGKTKKRRSRGARHYLITGALMLTPEDISLLSQYSTYGKTSS